MASESLILAGGGHTHALLLRHWAMHPRRRPQIPITLISSHGNALYSGMVPALIAGLVHQDEASINLRWLAQRAGVSFIQADVTALDLDQSHLALTERASVPFDILSLNVGSITPSDGYLQAISIKPLEPALRAIEEQDEWGELSDSPTFHCVGAGLAALEVVMALRQRWPARPLTLHCGGRTIPRSIRTQLGQANIQISTSSAPDSSQTLLCTGSQAPGWLQDSGLLCNSKGRVFTSSTLQALGKQKIFAVGDCAVMQTQPRPPSGVWAVRAAKPLARNLERLSQQQTLLPWRPQPRAIQILGLTVGAKREAWMLWGPLVLGPHPLLWSWKRHLDHQFMERFRLNLSMQTSRGREPIPMECRGCAAKLPAAPLEQALAQSNLSQLATQPEDAHSLGSMGTQTTLLASVDGFPALLSDPWLNGRLTALHACSDLWASGARVTTAQAIVTVPAVASATQVELLSQTLAGVQSALVEQQASLIGGHTLESRQATSNPSSLDLQVSLSVTGETPPQSPVWRKGGVQAGDQLMLSRPLGTGVLFAAAMQGAQCNNHLEAALHQMQSSQHGIVEQLLKLQDQQPGCIHACTDITGFGLLGHLNEMLEASPGIAVELWMDSIPVHHGAMDLFTLGFSSTLAPANRRALANLGRRVHVITAAGGQPNELSPALEALLIDPQTCGPLLISVSPTTARQLLETDESPWSCLGIAKGIQETDQT